MNLYTFKNLSYGQLSKQYEDESFKMMMYNH